MRIASSFTGRPGSTGLTSKGPGMYRAFGPQAGSGVPFVWIRPLVCRWKIHLGRDNIMIVNPRIVRDPSGVPTDRAPDGVVVPQNLVGGAASSFRYGTEKKCTETDRKKGGRIRTFQEHIDNICPILLVWTRTQRGSLSTIYLQRGTLGQNLLHIVGKLKSR